MLSSKKTGIKVECLKLSRAEETATFILRQEVEADAENQALWTTARLTCPSEGAADDERAKQFILEQLAKHGDLNSGQIRESGKGTGISQPDLASALKSLEATGRVRWRPGSKQNEKRWSRPDLETLPDDSRQAGQGNLPNLPRPARQVLDRSPEPAPPLSGAGRVR